MSETTMPAAEANTEVLDVERNSYELAFHVLPTVAEGEVQGVFDAIKALITKDGGEIFDEEAPLRFELAYEITKRIEGKNRRFTSAYFGWVRFKVAPEAIVKLLEEVEGKSEILRHLLIKLTRIEEENPFRFHESIESYKMVTTIDEADLVDEALTAEGAVEVSVEDVEKVLEKSAV
jgi:ribosomal protein S6